MDSLSNRFPIVCKLANKDGFICPGVGKFGACTVFTNNAVRAKERTGCAYKGIRAPSTVGKAVKVRVGQQKQAKRKIKTGAVAVAGADDK